MVKFWTGNICADAFEVFEKNLVLNLKLIGCYGNLFHQCNTLAFPETFGGLHMIVTCKAGDRFGIGNVVIEILQIVQELNAVEVRVITPEGSYVELIGPNDDADSDDAEDDGGKPVNRLLQYTT